jgi:hypothetical protein
MRPEPSRPGQTALLAVALLLVLAVGGIGGVVAARGGTESIVATNPARPEARPSPGPGGWGPGPEGGCDPARSDGMSGPNDACGMGRDGMRAMMGGPFAPDVRVVSNDDAFRAADAFLASRNDADLAYGDALQFANGYYIPVYRKSNGKLAFETYVDRVSGSAHLEMGPAMLWNTQYGAPARIEERGRMMATPTAGGPTATAVVTIDRDEATRRAQRFLDTWLPGSRTGDVREFPGYRSFDVVQASQTVGILSVRDSGDSVWFHNWLGDFIGRTSRPAVLPTVTGTVSPTMTGTVAPTMTVTPAGTMTVTPTGVVTGTATSAPTATPPATATAVPATTPTAAPTLAPVPTATTAP